jgi:hypothetical protein
LPLGNISFRRLYPLRGVGSIIKIGPLISGPQGSLFLAIYDNAPSFIEPPDNQKDVAPETGYET